MGFLKKARDAFRRKLDALCNRECEKAMYSAHRRFFSYLYKIRLVENALNVGDKIPDFTVEDAQGQVVSISERLKQGPLVIKFFRGTWCMFCSTDLQFLNDNYDEITSLGASAIAISTMPQDASKRASDEIGLKYSAISDTKLEIAQKFGLVIRLNDELVNLYKENYGVDLTKIIGKKDVDLILPSTYVVNQQGVITYAFLEEDFRKRADITEVLRVLRKAKVDAKKYASKCHDEECKIEEFIKSMIKGVKRSNSLNPFKKAKGASKSELMKFSSDVSLNEKDPFVYTLQHEDFLNGFKSYLEKTFCTENFLFYFDTAEFRTSFSSQTPEENKAQATRIFETFIQIGSDLEVNIDDETREKIVSDMREGKITLEMFNLATKEIYILMESDSFTKWKRTKEYADLWKNAGSLDYLSPVPGFAEAA